MDRGDDPTLIVEPETMPESSGNGDGTFDRDKFSVKNALDFLAQWFETNDKSDKTIKKLQSDTNTVKPIWKRPLLSLTKLECHKLHKHIRDKVRGKANADALAGEYGHFIGNYAANSALTHLQLAFNKCQYWLEEKGFPQDALNPIRKGFPWYPERSNRDRIKMGGKPHEKNQLPEWWDETERTLNAVEKMIWRLSLFTGFRNRDCCKIRWDEIKNIDDDTTATMFRPEPKGGKHRAFHVPLSTAALAILRERREAQDKAAEKNPTMRKCPWVFPTYSKAGMLTRVEVVDNQETVNGKKTPNKILGKHHNLRRTFETALKHSGVEKQDRQALMNHKYAVKSSDVHDGYDEPDTEFVRSKTQAAADFIMQRGGLSIDEHGKLVRKVDTQPPQPLRIAS
ncbi:MAG TPA: tyrosine-type recombinase/integrase [Tepidisphaeraceae bacterium]|nr:tyrosine-type recombinase/integrase [Tepidisphaeraceae bacterium]